MRIVSSWPHDGNVKLLDLIRGELEARSREVWVDAGQIMAGDD